ncbi:methyltransferase domain-containing protein [Shinella sp. G-2]|uniref:methyltransferase domain-containing protein n=1 Tax=Shinella sp. G-2 TaxID=3133141 RepID=UPI003D06E74F
MSFNPFSRRRASDTGAVRPMLVPDVYAPEVDIYEVFRKNVREKQPSHVLEVGTRRTVPERSTHSRDSFPWVAHEDYVRLDIRDGIDVDMLGDIHALPAEWTDRFGCFIADAVFEHLERPWVAAKEVARVLEPGAPFLVATHQCYPLHGHPNDFFRFSKEALRLIFEDAGLIVDAAEYAERCMIVPPEHILPYGYLEQWNRDHPSYAMVRVTGRHP